MIRVHPSQPAFVGGEMSQLLLGRHDIERFLLGGKRVENFIVRHQGPLVRRRGFQYVRDEACVAARLLNFEFSRSEAEMLRFGCGEIVVGADAPPLPPLPAFVTFEQFDGPFEFPAWLPSVPGEAGEGDLYYLSRFVSGETQVKYAPYAVNPSGSPCEIGAGIVGLAKLEFAGGVSFFVDNPTPSGGMEVTEYGAGMLGPFNYWPSTLTEIRQVTADNLPGLLAGVGTPFIPSQSFSYRLADTHITKYLFRTFAPGFFASSWGGFDNCEGEVDYRHTDPVGPEELGEPIARIGAVARTQSLVSFDSGTRTYTGTKSRAQFVVATDPTAAKVTAELRFVVTPTIGDPYEIVILREEDVAGATTPLTVEYPWIVGASVTLQSWNFSHRLHVFEDWSSFAESEFISHTGTDGWPDAGQFTCPAPNSDCWDDFSQMVAEAVPLTIASGYGWADGGSFVAVDPVTAYEDFSDETIRDEANFRTLGFGWAGAGFVIDYTRESAYSDFASEAAGTITEVADGPGWTATGTFTP